MSNDWNWTVDLGSGTASFGKSAQQRDYPHEAGFFSDTSEAFRNARAGVFTIWIVSPPGYSHSRCFEEVALALQSAFLDLGFRVPVVADPARAQGTVIVLGPHLLSRMTDSEASWPREMILFNLEQVSEGSFWMTAEYRNHLKRHRVWDYSARNVEALRGMGIEGVTLCPIGHAPALSRIEPARERDVDVLFIGSLNKRRREALKNLQAAGIDARWGFDVYGRDRDRWFSRAKLILNLHLYEAKVFEIVRVSYLLANRLCVVSETGSDHQLEEPFREAVAFANLDGLTATCERLLSDEGARQQLRDSGFRIFSSMPQRDFLQTALRASGFEA
jgi:hypothetical protein